MAGERGEVTDAEETETLVHRAGQPGAGNFPAGLFTRSFQRESDKPFLFSAELGSPCKHLRSSG